MTNFLFFAFFQFNLTQGAQKEQVSSNCKGQIIMTLQLRQRVLYMRQYARNIENAAAKNTHHIKKKLQRKVVRN